MYLKEIGRISLLSPEEEAELSYTLTVRVKDIIAAKRAIKKAKK